MRFFESYEITPNVFSSLIRDSDMCKLSDAQEICKGIEDHFCYRIKEQGFYFQLSDDYNTDMWYAAIEIASAFIGLLFFLFVYYTKEL